MLYIIEIPHQKRSTVWTASDKLDFVNRVSESPGNSRTDIYETMTISEALASYGLDSVEEARSEEPWLAKLADQIGGEGRIYRQGNSEFQAEPIDIYDAYKNHLAQDLSQLLIFDDESAALAAVNTASMWDAHGGQEARSALQGMLRSNQVAV